MQFKRFHNVRKGIVTAVSVGEGWAKFLEDQKLGPGAFLTFEVVDSRRLVAALHHRSAPADFAIPLLPDVDTQLARDRLYRESADAPVTHPRQSPEVPRSAPTLPKRSASHTLSRRTPAAL